MKLPRSFLIVPLLMAGCFAPGPALWSSRPAPQRQAASLAASAPRAPEAPHLKRLENGRYRVRKPWTVELDGKRWVVPKGYTTNGITAPDSLKKQLGDGVQYKETWAAVFHDWLFTQPGVKRAEADRTFHQLLLAYGVPPAKARLMYTTVAAYSLTRRKP